MLSKLLISSLGSASFRVSGIFKESVLAFLIFKEIWSFESVIRILEYSEISDLLILFEPFLRLIILVVDLFISGSGRIKQSSL